MPDIEEVVPSSL